MTEPTSDSQTDIPSVLSEPVQREAQQARSSLIHHSVSSEAASSGVKVGWAMQFVGAGLLLLSLGLFAAWAIRLSGGTKASRDNATLAAATFGIWALVGAVFLGVGTFIRRPK
jgi:hypothetical protein